jgi:acyl CoA:acetate/3-ketoacid CoA transferase beta subunit
MARVNVLCVDSTDSFGMIRGGHMDVAILGVCFILVDCGNFL